MHSSCRPTVQDLHPTWAPEETPPETPYVNPNYSEEEKVSNMQLNEIFKPITEENNQ